MPLDVVLKYQHVEYNGDEATEEDTEFQSEAYADVNAIEVLLSPDVAQGMLDTQNFSLTIRFPRAEVHVVEDRDRDER